MKGNNWKKNAIIPVVAGVVVAVIVVFLCLNFFGDKQEKDKNGKQKDVITYVIEKDKVNNMGGNTDYLSNEKCNASSINKRYSLKLDNGVILVNNLDTMENFLINKINNISTMIEFNYEKTCDTAMYAVLTNDGQVFYTDDDITKTKNVKKIEDQFMLLKSDLRFSEIFLGEENSVMNLYAKTTSGNLYKIDFR